jgi:hypothetical protein
VLEYSILLWITLSTARRVHWCRLTARNVGKRTLGSSMVALEIASEEDIAKDHGALRLGDALRQ